MLIRILKGLLMYVVLPAAILAMLGGGAAWYGLRWARAALDPVDPDSPLTLAVRVPRGATTQDVADILERNRLIRVPLLFRFYARQENLDSQILPGEYLLSPRMSVDQILEKLTKGEVITYRFTVPEGLNVEQVADLLADKRLVNREKFLAAADESIAADGWVPAGVGVRHRLEGYLFPETYTYSGTVTEKQIVNMMVGRFAEVIEGEYLQRAKELGLTVHEVITLASIVEKEARVADERSRIAGVYLNRLKIKMKLDADPTVRYAINKPPSEPLLYKDLEAESPYNTYRIPGLPPGPIASPGEAAIRAVLFPEEHEFLYFMAKGDGGGEHMFGKTLSEHRRNIAEAERQRKAVAKSDS